MANDLLQFAKNMTARAAAYKVAASKLSIAAATAALTDLTIKTPVDTSQALSNWQVTLVDQASGNIEAYSPGIGGSTQAASAAEALSVGKLVLVKKKPGQTIWITNNLPYIKRLNEGYSKQAPAGFVERSVLIGRNVIRTYKA